MASAKMLNREKIVARLLRIPTAVKAPVAETLKIEVDELVAAMQRAAPVGGPMDPHPGAFRDSIHAYRNPDRDLSWRIIADAKDEHGHFVGKHIEYGHVSPDGVHVPASPSFWPTYRARRKAMRRRLNAAARKVIKSLFPKEAQS